MASNYLVVQRTYNGESHSFSLPVHANDYKISMEQIWSSNSGRNASGKYIGTKIADKFTISGVANIFNEDDMAEYLSIVNADEFNVTFINPQTKQRKTIKCYRETPVASVYSYHSQLPRYNPVAFNFIEI